MKLKKRILIFLPLTIISFAAFIYFLLAIGPNAEIPLSFLNTSFPSMYIFFILQFLAMFCLFSLLLNLRRGILLSLYGVSILILKLNGLAHPFFLLLLTALFIILELTFKKQKSTK